MKKLRLTYEVARWEFTRFYKLKNELKSAAYMLLIGVGVFFVGSWMGRGAQEKPEVVIINDGGMIIDSTLYDHFIVTYAGREELDTFIEKVGTREIDALLLIHSLDEGELFIRYERPWILQLQQMFTDFRRISIIGQTEIAPEIIDQLLEPFAIRTVLNDEGARGARGTERGFAIGFIIAMIVAVFVGFGYQFTAITGEKQQRITEQVISAISPQTWIDGKILGISAIGIVSVLFYGTIVLLGFLGVSYFVGAGIFSPLLQVTIWKIGAFLILCLLGVLLWNSFFAAIAATINDPNTSERSVFMLFPIVPVAFAFGALINPDMLIVKILGLFPLTSSSMLPARMVLTDVHRWEFIVAVILLLATIWLFRKVAAKIFSFGMLMYGKEPDIKEMWRWIREA